MSDAERYADLDDQRLAWQIPGDMGLEVARRWRLLNDEVERLKAEVARLERDRTRLLFSHVYRLDDGWYVKGWCIGEPFATRQEAVDRYVATLAHFWDWPSERRRRKEEGWPDDAV